MAGVLSAPSAGAQVLVGRTALHRVQVPAGAARPATVACPGGYLATSGGISAAAPGVVLLRAEPAGSGRYAFALANRGGNPRGVTVAVACRRLRAASATMDMKQLEPRSFQVGPGTQRSAVLTCPARRVAAGAGVDVGLGGTQLSVRRLAADLRGFSFTVRNAGRRARAVAVSGNCITVISRPGSPLLHLRVKVVTFRQPLGPGRRTITRACPRGWLSLAAGYSLPAPSLMIEGAPALAGARWSVVNSGDAPTRVVLQLTCGRVVL